MNYRPCVATIAALLLLAGVAPAAERRVAYPAKLPPGLTKAKAQGRYISTRDKAVMVYVPAGLADLGSDNHDEDESPRHRSNLSAFFIDVHEVTNTRYAQFLDWWKKASPAQKRLYSHRDEPKNYDHTPAFWPQAAPAKTEGDKGAAKEKPKPKARPHPDEPVTGVSWYSAYAYARWAGKSLPTEAQWEKAARGDMRGGPARDFPWGAVKPDFTLLNFAKNVGKPTRVGTYKTGASAAGCLDMGGNVWEWCLDFYHKDFYKTKAGKGADPANLFPSPFRVNKGGSYASDEVEVRPSYRDRSKPTARFADLGFRCVVIPQTKGRR